jgi:prophage regulatory protein
MDQSTAKFLLQEYEQLHRLCMMQSRMLERFGQPDSEPESGERLIRLPEVLRRCGISKRSISRLEAAGRFPARRQLGPRAVGWSETEIRSWMANPTGWSRTSRSP